MKNSKLHSSFSLNGKRFSNTEELLNFSKQVSTKLYIFIEDWLDNTKDEVVVNTSGSTGKPKPIKLKKTQMINSAKATAAFFGVKENTTALCCLPIDFIAGKMMLARAMVLGWNLDYVEPTSNPLTNNANYDFVAMIPLQLKNSLQKLHQIKTIIVGGGVVSNEIIQSIQNVKTAVFATYGMTETITHIAVKKLNNFSANECLAESYYQTLPNVKVAKDDRNCLIISAPKVSDEVVVTNDVVDIIAEDKFLWKGRFDHVINSGGIKLYPEEIEAKLSEYIKPRFFVAGVSDVSLGEKLVLVVEGKKQDLPIDFKKVLQKFQIPKAIYFVDAFVETSTKKIQRNKTLDLI